MTFIIVFPYIPNHLSHNGIHRHIFQKAQVATPLQTKCIQHPTPFSDTVYHALLNSVTRFVLTVSSWHRFLIGWHDSTARMVLCEEIWKTYQRMMSEVVCIFVSGGHFCLRKDVSGEKIGLNNLLPSKWFETFSYNWECNLIITYWGWS